MINPYPLLIVMGTIVALVAIQRFLTKMDGSPRPQPEAITPPPPPPPPPAPRPRGSMLFTGLSVIGLDERGVEHLRNLINKGESGVLASFLASHRPGVLELDTYLEQLRAEFHNALPDIANKLGKKNIQDTIKIFEPVIEPPGNIHIKPLDIYEYEAILTFDPQSQRLVTRDLMAKFNGQKFSKYFEYYCSHHKSVAMSIPPLDPDRPIIETLTESGIASKGRHIPLETRLTILKMNQLRQMCKDLNVDAKFTRKKDAVETLAQIPGAAVLLSMIYVVDDLFTLNPLEDEVKDIKREWSYLSAYAKLLISRTNPNVAPTNH